MRKSDLETVFDFLKSLTSHLGILASDQEVKDAMKQARIDVFNIQTRNEDELLKLPLLAISLVHLIKKDLRLKQKEMH